MLALWWILGCVVACGSWTTTHSVVARRDNASGDTWTLLNSSRLDNGDVILRWFSRTSRRNGTLVQTFFKCTARWKQRDGPKLLPRPDRPSETVLLKATRQHPPTYRCAKIDPPIASDHSGWIGFPGERVCEVDADCRHLGPRLMVCNRRRRKCEPETLLGNIGLWRRSLGERCYVDKECYSATNFSVCDKFDSVCRCKRGFAKSGDKCELISATKKMLEKAVAAVGGLLFLCLGLFIVLTVRRRRLSRRLLRAQEARRDNCSCGGLHDKPPSYEDILKETEPPPPYPGLVGVYVIDDTGLRPELFGERGSLRIEDPPADKMTADQACPEISNVSDGGAEGATLSSNPTRGQSKC